MADEKTNTPALEDLPLDDALAAVNPPQPEVKAAPAPAFKADAFLAGKSAEAAKPQIVKRGGIGLFTAFLMSSVAAIGGAYLALFAGARPDLLQQAGISAFVPKPAAPPSLGTDGGNMAPLAARVSAVEAELLALKTRLEGGASPQPSTGTPILPAQDNAPAVVLRPDAPNAVPATPPPVITPPVITTVPTPLGTELKGELAGIAGRVTAIETRLAALDPTGAGGAIVAGLQADIAGLKAIIGTLQQQAASAPSPAATFAVVNLAEAANRAGPFMIELETVRAAMPGVPEVAALEEFARTGVPTRAALQEQFVGLSASEAAAATTAAAAKDTGILAWFKGLFADMVKVQAAPNANATGSVATLARAKTKLDQGDLAGSVAELATITTPSPPVTDWMTGARKRLELESRVSALRGAVGRAPVAAAPVAAAPPALVPPATVPVPAPKTQGITP